MDLAVWIALVLLFLAGGLTPGPAVMLVVTCSLRYGFWPAMLPALGICVANLLWTGLAVSGVSAVARAFPLAFVTLKLVGLAFITMLGWRLFRTDHVRLERESAPPRTRLFASGVGLQLGNPNALVYFGGMLPAYLDPGRPLGTQAAIVMASVTLTELAGLATYGAGADMLARRFASRRFAVGFFRLAALCMVISAALGVYATWR
jgi:threonine/homoserine/homoserine lactone efflux protein